MVLCFIEDLRKDSPARARKINTVATARSCPLPRHRPVQLPSLHHSLPQLSLPPRVFSDPEALTGARAYFAPAADAGSTILIIESVYGCEATSIAEIACSSGNR